MKTPLPSGTVTLLFTDIEGSTQRWEQRRAAMADALRQHDELVRTAIEAHGGYVFKTVGDAFCAAFSRASDAIAAAVDAQRALAGQDWSAVGELAVRVALHTGATEERDGDYFGPCVNRVARLLATGHGGQTIVSGATAPLLRGAMPEQTELRDLGEHRLKDLVEPEHVWQLIAPDLRDTFPSLRSLGSMPNNLPRQLTPLIGRENVLGEIELLVLEHPLVTVVGTGGIGKTRVALQAAADLLDGSGDGVWFVELAALSDPRLVASTIASVLGVGEQPDRPILQTLLHYLKSRRLLLVLDNCEHVVEEAATIADAVLRNSPNVRMLATSRESLRIHGERVYRMPSLSLPDAIALFAQRATAGDARFRLTDDVVTTVAQICRRLDGIAFAIELAAARVKVLTPQQLERRLDERFRVLTAGSRTALPRQQTMRALIDWSYGLLSERERKLFRSTAVFVGGWTLEAAEAVCSDDTVDALDVVELLASLVEKSLVAAEADATGPRYRLLESTRAFALEKLEENTERELLAHRHAQWAADLADDTSLYAELDNARSAIEWALLNDRISLAARIAAKFTRVWRRNRGIAEARRWLEEVLARLDVDADPAVAAHAWLALSLVTSGTRKAEAATRAFELAQSPSDPVGQIDSLYQMATGFLQSGRIEEAEAANVRALEISKAHGLTRSSQYAATLDARASIMAHRGRMDEARQAYVDALALVTALGEARQANAIRANIADFEFGTGDAERALKYGEEALAAARESRSTYIEVSLLANSAAYRLTLGDLDGARAAAREALSTAKTVQRYMTAASAIQHLAAVAALRGDVRRGARLCGYVDACYRQEGNERDSTERRTYEMLMTALHSRLTDAEIEALTAEGAQLSEDAAAAEALAV